MEQEPSQKTPEKRPVGRQEGWRKHGSFTSKLSFRIPQHLDEWLKAEADKRGLTCNDVARMFLLEMKMRYEEEAARKEV